jgi:RNA polymerase sigma factor (sigma-70 family)
VVQDGWLSILRKLRQLRQPEAFGGWAMQIVAHAAAEHLRRARRQAEAIRAMSAEPAPRPAEQPATFDRRLLAGLTEPQLQAIILYYWEQMPLAQIAETLGVPVGTVKSRLYHARQNFKHLLGEEP